jgi:hypothetical protein
MKKVFAVLASLLFLSGCIQITEEVFIEKDGSGKYQMTVDLEQMQEMMDMFKAFGSDSTGDKTDMGQAAYDSLQNSMGDLSNVPGITEFKKEKVGNKIEISFRFRDAKALNDAMRKRSEKSANNEDLYVYSPGNFEFRDTTVFGLGDLNNKMNGLDSGSDSTAMAMEMVKGLMGEMTYTTIYHFPGKVTNFTNKDAKLDEDGKTLRLKVNMFDKEKQATLQNKVTYRK